MKSLVRLLLLKQISRSRSSTITATVVPGLAADLAGITMRSGRVNALTLTPTDTSASATALKAVKDLTSLLGVTFTNVTTIAASPSTDITALFAPLATNGTSANTS